ncbi:MAG: TolC family protein, partial [Amphiplicatus sp.]
MPSSFISRATSLLLVGVSLSACTTLTMAPDYNRPKAPIANVLPYVDGDANEIASLVSWRSVFSDPTLQALIETALVNNRDLRVATLNVERARALYRIQRADSLPSVAASGDYSNQRFGENASTGIAGAPSSGSGPITIEQFSATAGVSAYELDLFGRVRSLNRQALETYFATDEARKAAQISLVAEVAAAYLQLAADRELLALARNTFESQQASRDLTQQLVDTGVGNNLDVQRARTSIERA